MADTVIHTPGRLRVWYLALDKETYGENAGKPILTTEDGEEEIAGVIDNAHNAERLVKCWNACVGIDPKAVPMLLRAVALFMRLVPGMEIRNWPPGFRLRDEAMKAGTDAMATAHPKPEF